MTPSDDSSRVRPVDDGDNADEAKVKHLGYAVTDDGHWIWSRKMLKGHPVISEGGRYVHASRYLWRRRYYDLPGRARLRRMCDADACVRPEHYTLASPREVMLKHGRNMTELVALVSLLQYKETQFGPERLCWEPDEWALDPSIVRDLSVATGSPLWVVMGAYAKLAHTAWSKGHGRAVRAEGKTDSERCASAARSLVEESTKDDTQDDTPGEGRWLPPA